MADHLHPEAEKWRACVHEGGHAVLSVLSPHASDPGEVWVERTDDLWLGRTWKPLINPITPAQAVAEITMAYGGAAAEEVVLGGCNRVAESKDALVADEILRKMGTDPDSDVGRQIKMRGRIQAVDYATNMEIAVRAVAEHLYRNDRISDGAALISIVESALPRNLWPQV